MNTARSIISLAIAGLLFGCGNARDLLPKSVLPDCPPLVLTLSNGLLNGISADAPRKEIMAALPCYTGTTPDGDSHNFGGGVFYLNHQLFFYTHQDYIEVRKGFAGTVEPPVMTQGMPHLLQVLGAPDQWTNQVIVYADAFKPNATATVTWCLWKMPYGWLSAEGDSNLLHNIKVYQRAGEDASHGT